MVGVGVFEMVLVVALGATEIVVEERSVWDELDVIELCSSVLLWLQAVKEIRKTKAKQIERNFLNIIFLLYYIVILQRK